MVSKCIKKCGRQVSHAENTCGTCKKASEMESCNIINRTSSNLCINNCGSGVACKGNICLTCAEAQGLTSGDITGKLKAFNGIRSDAATATAAKYERLYSNVDNSSKAQAKALAVVKTNLTVKLAAVQAKNPGHVVTASVFVASKGRGHLVLHEGRESSLKQGNRQGCIVKLENHDGATY
jgi:hypothetical protein